MKQHDNERQKQSKNTRWTRQSKRQDKRHSKLLTNCLVMCDGVSWQFVPLSCLDLSSLLFVWSCVCLTSSLFVSLLERIKLSLCAKLCLNFLTISDALSPVLCLVAVCLVRKKKQSISALSPLFFLSLSSLFFSHALCILHNLSCVSWNVLSFFFLQPWFVLLLRQEDSMTRRRRR